MTTPSAGRRPPLGLERAAWLALLAFAAALQVSIAAAQVLLALTAVLWLALIVRDRERIEVPRMFWPLRPTPARRSSRRSSRSIRASASSDTKQLVLFAIVPIAYRAVRGQPQPHRPST